MPLPRLAASQREQALFDHQRVHGNRATQKWLTGQVNRTVLREPDLDSVRDAGEEGAKKASMIVLPADKMNVRADLASIDKLSHEIEASETTIKEAENDDDSYKQKGALVENEVAKTKLQILKGKLDVTGTDTAAFASQYRIANTDYERLRAEATKFISADGGTGDIAAKLWDKGPDLKMDESQVGLQRFRTARQNLNTAAVKMDGEMTAFRGAAIGLQSGVNKVRGNAAAAKKASAQSELDALNKEIAEVAAGVGKAVQVATRGSGLRRHGCQHSRSDAPGEQAWGGTDGRYETYVATSEHE